MSYDQILKGNYVLGAALNGELANGSGEVTLLAGGANAGMDACLADRVPVDCG